LIMGLRAGGAGEVKLRICLECGAKCCYASPLLTIRDVERMSKYLGIQPSELVERCCAISREGGYAFIRLRKVEGRCIFLSDKLCRINPVKPMFCRVFPINYTLSGLGGFHCPLAENSELLAEEVELYPKYLEELEELFRVVARCGLDLKCILSSTQRSPSPPQ